MEDTSSPKATNTQNRLPIIGLLLLIVPLKLASLRLYSLHVFSQNANFPFRGMVRSFLSNFANFGQDPIITAIILILAVGSLVISVLGYPRASKTFKLVSAFVIGVSLAILVLQFLMTFSTKTA